MFQRLLLFLSVLFLASCNATTPTPPVPGTSDSSADNGSGVISGVLLDEQNQPIENIGVFLADLTPGPEGAGNIISFQLHSSKRGITDSQGRFTIEGVNPGSYSLAIWTPNETQLVPSPSDGEGSAIQVDVAQGQSVDVGKLVIRRPR